VQKVEQFLVGKFVAEKYLDEKWLAGFAFGQGSGEPVVQFGAPRFGDVVNFHVQPLFALDDLFFHQPFVGHLREGAVDLALVGVPEMLNRFIEGFFQVVA